MISLRMLPAVSIEPTAAPETTNGTRAAAIGGMSGPPASNTTLPSASKTRWRISLSSASGTSMSWLRR